ncbi:MAG: nuclear transport factor 2 family protein [Vicinamibacterales bacterium]
MSRHAIAAFTVALAAAVASCSSVTPPQPDTAEDRAQVLALERDVALVLAKQGFDAYAALFHADYTNWSGGDAALDRQTYLDRVKTWYDAGNHAVAVNIRPVSIEIMGDLALSRYVLREQFSDGTAFVGQFASLARRHERRWLLYRTSFSTIFRGPVEDAPGLAP